MMLVESLTTLCFRCWVHSSIHKHLMSACHVPGSVVSTRDAGDSRTAVSLAVRIPVSAAVAGSLMSLSSAGRGISLAGDKEKSFVPISLIFPGPRTPYLVEEIL